MMSPMVWIGFIIFVLGMLYVDLVVLSKKKGQAGLKQSLIWTCFCIFLALAFNAVVYFLYEGGADIIVGGQVVESSGEHAALQFFTGWLIEQLLSLDNIFVISLIFSYFRVPAEFQHRVLLWGIMGVLILRGAMIAVGAYLIHGFPWMHYLFGGLLILGAIQIFLSRDKDFQPEKNLLFRLARRIYPVSKDFHGDRFFVKLDGRWHITPLLLVLVVIESTDVVFAFDSIPAVFAITEDPFLVFTSNIFAVLNLRSLYFVLASLVDKFRHLETSILLVLVFVGVKMLLQEFVEIPTVISLLAIFALLLTGILFSLKGKKHRK